MLLANVRGSRIPSHTHAHLCMHTPDRYGGVEESPSAEQQMAEALHLPFVSMTTDAR